MKQAWDEMAPSAFFLLWTGVTTAIALLGLALLLLADRSGSVDNRALGDFFAGAAERALAGGTLLCVADDLSVRLAARRGSRR